MQYKFTKCPHCGHSIEAWKSTGWNDIEQDVGAPVGICPSCNQLYGTGKTEWQQTDVFGRIVVYARIAFGAIFGGLVAGMVLLLPLIFLNAKFNWIESNEAYRTATYTCLLLGILYSTWAHLSRLKDLK